MSNLVPVKRANKHGVMVTRHVREDTVQRSGARMPAPALGKPAESGKEAKERAELAKRLKRMHKPRARSFNRKKMGIYATQSLEKFFKTTYKITCSDDDFYTVLEKMRLSDTFVLMAAGLKPEQRDAFIANNNFHIYGEDNTELVEGLRSRGIPLENYLEAVNDPVIEWRDTPFVIDAAETYAMFSKADSYPRGLLPQYVGSDMVDIDDIKALGVDRCGLAEFIYLLSEFKKGTTKCTAEELAAMLDRLEKDDEFMDKAEHRTVTAVRARLAVKLGVPFMESINNPMSLYYAEESITGMDEDAAISFLNYVDQTTWDEPVTVFDDDKKWVRITVDRKSLWEAGMDVDTAREGLEAGMTADQIIGVHRHGIEPVVSSGWL